MLPTRGRPELALKSMQSLIDTADNVSEVEFMLCVDDDDQQTIDYVNDSIVPYFEEKDIDLTAYVMPRFGYGRLNEYVNHMAFNGKGKWLITWNDDARMESSGWDTEIMLHDGEFRLLGFTDNHNQHPYAIFPIIPRDWIVLFGTVSPQQQLDAWTSQVSYLNDAFVRLKTVCTHDRADLTGNNDDEIYQTRVYHEGDITDPLDLNNPKFHVIKQQWAVKLDWYLKRIGQSTGYLDKWTNGGIDCWTAMNKNDPNKQMHQFKVEKEQFNELLNK